MKSPLRTRARRGFTLVEIMIVSALIALLSALAVFSIQQFYTTNVRKACIGELNRLYTALEFAHQDLAFYPKLSYLNSSREQVLFDQASQTYTGNSVIAHLDYYGFLPGGAANPVQARVNAFWSGPYFGMSQARGKSNRGLASGLVTVRLADVWEATNGIDPNMSRVQWPADPWGNPYVVYQLRTEIVGGGAGRAGVFIGDAGQQADYLNAIVSYGPNKIPGGNIATGEPLRSQLKAGALYTDLDPLGGLSGLVLYTMKSANPVVAQQYRLETTFNANHQPVFDSLNSLAMAVALQNNDIVAQDAAIQAGDVGMLDPGTDDIVVQF